MDYYAFDQLDVTNVSGNCCLPNSINSRGKF